MSTLTKEWLLKTIAELEEERDAVPGVVNEDAAMALAAMKRALASLEAEAGVYQTHVIDDGCGEFSERMNFSLPVGTKLYTAPPAPVSVPDERYQHLSELYHAQEKRLFKLAQRIKGPAFDKYAHSPSQAIDVLESEIFGEREGGGRAAMLQGAEPVTTANKLPANVIDALEKALQAMSFMGDTLNDMDAVCEEDIEYVTPAFDAVRKVLEGNSPVIPDGWVACSERMPPPKTGVIVGCWFGRNWATKWATYLPYHPDAHQSGFLMPGGSWTPTHWIPLPAAPQQEVK